VSTHPYWAYEAVPGTIDQEVAEKAVAEGRRAFALELAVSIAHLQADRTALARRFEEYLKGEPVEGNSG
jgi:hypothetical protein